MKGVKNYDGDLQMFREVPTSVNLDQLRFLRWLVERGRLEHLPYGPPSGEFVPAPLEPALTLLDAA